MGYNTSSAALAYDMNAMPAYRGRCRPPLLPVSSARRALMSTRARAVRQTRR